MTPIEKLEKLLAESTPGPWDFTWSEGEIEILDAGTGPDGRLYPGCEELYIYSSGESLICKEADLALIVELRNNAEALLAALRTQGEQGWQDIATAPKDGTMFLAWCPSVGIVAMMFHDAIRSETWSLLGRAKNPEPTHWRPIPTPPVLES